MCEFCRHKDEIIKDLEKLQQCMKNVDTIAGIRLQQTDKGSFALKLFAESFCDAQIDNGMPEEIMKQYLFFVGFLIGVEFNKNNYELCYH